MFVAGDINAGFHSSDLVYDLGITTARGSVDAVIHGMAVAADLEISWILLAN